MSESVSPSSSPSAGYDASLYRWDGSAWVLAKLNTYTGGSFQNKTMSYWDGSAWKSVNITGV